MPTKFSHIFFLLLTFISFHCNASDDVIHHPDFRREWQAFLSKKTIKPNPENKLDYEFSLLEEFSDKMIIRNRPYLPAMDRYMECRPYHDNRILLKDGTEMSASWIRLPGDYLPFIATQAPLQQNVHLFWQMVVENEVDQMIMLTELFENPENELCYAYWPHVINEKLSLENGIEVKLIDEKELLVDLKEKIQIRTFSVTFEGMERKVTHYWYRNWLDDTAPYNHALTFDTMIEVVEKDKKVSNPQSPIMVHCAAGIGRTGVFICLYHLKQRKKLNDTPLNLFDFIAYLRWQRPYMVGMPDQYKFCHQVHNSLYDHF